MEKYSVNFTVLPWLRIATGSLAMPAFACISFAPHGDVHRYYSIIPRLVMERQRLVTDRPFARGEVPDRDQRAKQSQNGNSTFNDRPRRIDLRRRQGQDLVRSLSLQVLPQEILTSLLRGPFPVAMMPSSPR